VVEGFLRLADQSENDGVAGEAFNFSDESPRTVIEIYTAVCKAVGAGEVEPLVLDSAVGEIKDQYLDATKARDVLGWDAAVTLDDGLARTVAWYQELLSGAK
jgi:CDP-glucose 4,6-dehydratase